MNNSAPKDVMRLMSGNVLAKLFGIASMVLFTRVLSKGQMAIFPAYLMLAGLPPLLMTFGIYASFIRDLPSLMRTDLLRARSLVMTGSALVLIGAIVPCIACWWWSDLVSIFVFKDAAQSWVIASLSPAFLAYTVSKAADSVMWGRGQFGAMSLVQILESVARPVLTIMFYFWLGYPGVVLGIVCAQFVVTAVALWYVRDMFLGPLPPMYPVKRLLADSMPYYVSNYLSYLKGDGDTILVTALLGPSALAEYYVAKTLFTNVWIIWTSIDRVAVERLGRVVNTDAFNARVRDLHFQLSKVVVPFALLVIAVAPNAMVLLAGVRYVNSTLPAIILLVGSLTMFIAIPYDRAVYVGLPAMTRLKFTIIEATIIVTTALVLAPIAGLVGVAFARVLAPVGACVFSAYLLHKHLQLDLSFKPTLRALVATAPGAAVTLLFIPTAHGSLAAILQIGAAATVWLAISVTLAWCFDRELLTGSVSLIASRYHALVSS